MIWGLRGRGGVGRPGGVQDLEPAYAGADARRSTSSRGGSPPSGRRGSSTTGSTSSRRSTGSNNTSGPGGPRHPGSGSGRGSGNNNGNGRYGPAGTEDPDDGNHRNNDASRKPDTQEDRSHQNPETSTGLYYNRNDKGQFADRNGGSHDYELSEQAGMEQYRSDMKEVGIEIRKEISSKHLATVEGTDYGRYFDRIIQLDDGTWVGLEIKSGSATRTPQQRAFDSLVSPDNPAKVTLDDGTTIYVTKTDIINVARQEFPPAPENKGG